MPLDKNNPANVEIARRRALKPGPGQVIFRAAAEIEDHLGKVFKLPDQYRCKPKDFINERAARRYRWKKVMAGGSAA